MAVRGKLYRCHLFSFRGPRTEGVAARWTRELRPVGDRAVRTGERVEMYAVLEPGLLPDGAEPGVRFDLLEEDFLLTGGLDDRVLSIVAEGASSPGDEVPVERRPIRRLPDPGDRDPLEVLREAAAGAEEAILLLAESGEEGTRHHLLTAWSARRVADYRNAELYFLLHVEGRLDHRSDGVLDVSPEPSPWEPDVAAELTREVEPSVGRVEWLATEAEAGAEVGFRIDGVALDRVNAVRAEVVEAGRGAAAVARFDVPSTDRPPIDDRWRVPRRPTDDAYALRVGLDEPRGTTSLRPLRVLATLRARLTTPSGRPLAGVGYRVLAPDGEPVREGRTDASGRVVEEGLPPSHRRLELAGVEVEDVDDPEPPPAEPEGARVFALASPPRGDA